MCALNKYCQSLELDKILSMLSENCGCDDSKNIAKNLTPSNDFEEVRLLMKNTSDAYAMSITCGYPSVRGIINIKEKVKLAEVGASLSLKELLDIAVTLKTVASVYNYRISSEIQDDSLSDYFDSLTPLPDLESLICDSIISEEEIADTASAELREIRRKIRINESKIRDQLDKIVSSPETSKYLQERLVTQRNGRFVVPVKAEYRNDVKGMVHDASSSGATIFIEPASVVEANNEIKILKSKERDEINRIISAISAAVGRYSREIIDNYDSLVKIDVIFAKVRLASKMHAIAPELNKNGIVKLINARHPLIDPAKAVPISIEIGKDFDTVVVTGPNTGGKTVTLKTVGLFALMAACGLMIPASDGSSVAVFDSVFSDIGDEQSIEQSLSTFSAHITNIIEILGKANENSLVLLDELGAGTDPVEGAALAVAIIEKLRIFGAKIIASTHYAEIKMFALQTSGVENACCEFDIASLKPTYKLLIGAPGKSNAFAISKRLGMSEDIVKRAGELISNENTRFEDVVSKLEESRQSAEIELEKARDNRIRSENTKKELENMKRELEKEKEKEIERVKAESRRIIETLNAESSRILDELEEIKKAKDSADFSEKVNRARSQMKNNVNALYEISDPIEKKQSSYTLPRPLKSGDSVFISSFGKEGVVIEPPDPSGFALVQAGIIKTKVSVDELRLIDKKKVSYQGSVTKNITSSADRNIRTELDLRGKDSEEAIMDMEAYLDECILLGIRHVTLIHGKGSGVLRSVVRQKLKNNKAVKSYRSGVFGEGEDGVTIVELK
ncbi:MAG: endonuclease MutS2 [Oscillospiraceae bacterium]|nr:endonuclease MutS2 [Oscillospiraceae bacterium]